MKRKVCVVTGTRAEYGLLYLVIKAIADDEDLSLQLIATGTHLSEEFGLTYKEIEKDFTIDKKIDMKLEDDTPVGISKSMGLAQPLFSEAFEELKPDLLLILGDRYEIFSVVTAAMLANIPVAHISGGEATEGLIDEPIRHSITKMSHLHFTGADVYRKRVIQLGEQPKHVFNVGGMGVDNIKHMQLLSKDEFEKSVDFKLNRKNLLVTFHPVTLEGATSKKHFTQLLNSLEKLQDTNIIFTKANADPDGKIINELIDQYVKEHENSVQFDSLGRLRYLSALQYIDAVIGNSSSGLCEAPSFHIGTINIGDRQKGRIKAKSVIDCEPTTEDIDHALGKLYTDDFQTILKNVDNPYGNGGATEAIIKVIKEVDLRHIIKKPFFDIDFSL